MSFTNQSYLNDVCMSVLMGFEFEKIPLLSAGMKLTSVGAVDLLVNGKKATVEGLRSHKIDALPSSGWVDYLR